jgi:hypothetical protein
VERFGGANVCAWGPVLVNRLNRLVNAHSPAAPRICCLWRYPLNPTQSETATLKRRILRWGYARARGFLLLGYGRPLDALGLQAPWATTAFSFSARNARCRLGSREAPEIRVVRRDSARRRAALQDQLAPPRRAVADLAKFTLLGLPSNLVVVAVARFWHAGNCRVRRTTRKIRLRLPAGSSHRSL